MSAAAHVTGVRVGDQGVIASTDDALVLDVLFDGRRIWSFWLPRDGRPVEGGDGATYVVPWPLQLRRFLNGTTRVTITDHVRGHVAFDEEVALGDGEGRIAVVNERGQPVGIDKSLRLTQTFDTRSPELVAPLLDSVEEVLDALRRAGVEPFIAYGTLLGAVREGRLIGHDSDADLGYVSRHEHPADVILESYALQRTLVDMGYRVTRYSGSAFKVDVVEADGSVRGLDVFGGFLMDGRLYLMGEIGTPFQREWIFPLGTTTLEGRELPAPADPGRLLAATYGPGWRVPDPAYKFQTPHEVRRRLTGWFRGIRAQRPEWDRTYAGRLELPELEPSDLARFVVERQGLPDLVVDLGCGRGVDALWFARQGSRVLGLDFAVQGTRPVAAVAADEGLPLEFREMNLTETRSALGHSARITHEHPGPRVVVARHIADATDRLGRANLWRACEMLTRGGGTAYVELLLDAEQDDPFLVGNHLRVIPTGVLHGELEQRGATLVEQHVLEENNGPDDTRGRRIGRWVVEWHR